MMGGGRGRRHGKGGPPQNKAKDFKGTVARLYGYIGRYRIVLLIACVLAAGSTVMQIFGPKVLGRATTAIFEGLVAKVQGTGGIDFERIGEVLTLLLFLYLLGTLFQWVQGWLMAGLTSDVILRMRRDISEKINRMPMRYFEEHAVGETLSRITNDVDALGSSLSQSITQMISGLATLVGVLIMMLSINVLMAVIVVVIVPVSAALIALVFGKSRKYFQQQQELISDINAQVEESFSGHQVIKAFNREPDVLATFSDTNDRLYESAWKSQFLTGLMHPLMTFVGNLSYVSVVIFGSVLAAAGSIAVGDIQAFTQYARSFMQPINQFAQMSSQLQTMTAAAERIFAFLEEPEEDNAGLPLPKGGIRGEISFEGVSFGYVEGTNVIHDFICRVAPGQTVAIVGHTGAGKTTMVKLLMRFYDVGGGRILLDGRDIREYDRHELRKAFGMVLQDTWLFAGTIMENIRYGRLEATDEEVMAAASDAYADHFIRTLPDSYQMVLNEEADNISQGQRQLLTIARALLADAPVMILDEATSNVDTLTEQRIQQAMARLMQGRTSFVIAHRLSTIREADLILVMQDGNIVEQGTHDELIQLDSVYAELYRSQFETAV